MKTKHLFALTTLTLAAAAFADEAPGAPPLTRAEVRQAVLAARADGTLLHAGEAAPEETTQDRPVHAPLSGLTRAQLHASVLQALGAGTLAHAGPVAPEEDVAYARAHPSTSTLTRAEVRADLRKALADGALLPAGEAYPESPAERTHQAAAKPDALHSAE